MIDRPSKPRIASLVLKVTSNVLLIFPPFFVRFFWATSHTKVLLKLNKNVSNNFLKTLNHGIEKSDFLKKIRFVYTDFFPL